MRFKITRHRGHRGAPEDALDSLWDQISRRHEDVSFARRSSAIVATWQGELAAGSERNERAELGRLRVLEVLTDVCGQSPQLELGWYAVSPMD